MLQLVMILIFQTISYDIACSTEIGLMDDIVEFDRELCMPGSAVNARDQKFMP